MGMALVHAVPGKTALLRDYDPDDAAGVKRAEVSHGTATWQSRRRSAMFWNPMPPYGGANLKTANGRILPR